ncbi:MAG: hypothetical protein Q4F79_02310 [Eubacteriales bacterium]|nr:hypothetical protein [Eubacteriales bacterium]
MFKKKASMPRYRYQIVDDPDNAEFPKHPDKLSKQPNWTDRITGRIPTFYLYTALIGFGLAYLLVGVLGLILGSEPQKAMQWMGVIGLALGYGAGKYLIEPWLMIPFEKGTHAQQVDAVNRMNAYLREEEEEEAFYRQVEEEDAAQPDFDRAVFDDDEPIEEDER